MVGIQHVTLYDTTQSAKLCMSIGEKNGLVQKMTSPDRLQETVSATRNEPPVVSHRDYQMAEMKIYILYPNTVLETKVLSEMKFRLGKCSTRQTNREHKKDCALLPTC